MPRAQISSLRYLILLLLVSPAESCFTTQNIQKPVAESEEPVQTSKSSSSSSTTTFFSSSAGGFRIDDGPPLNGRIRTLLIDEPDFEPTMSCSSLVRLKNDGVQPRVSPLIVSAPGGESVRMTCWVEHGACAAHIRINNERINREEQCNAIGTKCHATFYCDDRGILYHGNRRVDVVQCYGGDCEWEQ